MSPDLFILCMERLSRDIDKEVSTKSWTPIKITSRGPKIFHLFFADDLTLFSRADHKNCMSINKILNNFNALSGQKINFGKSKVFFSQNCTTANRIICSYLLQIKHSDCFGKYLGFSIFNRRPTNSGYQFIIDNLHSRLAVGRQNSLT